MFKIESLSDSIADKLSVSLQLDTDKRDIIAYGAFALLQTIISIILVLIFGWIFGVVLEALIISFVVSILRKYSGGVHASTSDACTLIGTTVFIVLALLLSNLEHWISLELVCLISVATFLWCCYIVLKLAPVESNTKKISIPKKKRMKKGSIITLSVYVLLAIFIVVLYYITGYKKLLIYSLCISIGSVWQSFTLTKAGHLSLSKIDKFINYILHLGGGK
jgi:accessory gene regulator B